MISILKKTLIGVFSLVFVYLSYLMLILTLPYLSLDNTVAFLRSKQAIIHLDYWRVAFYVHVFSSIFILLIGFVQFFRFSNTSHLSWHRFLGKIYIFLILFLSGPAGLIMAFYANGGWIAQIGFIILALGWLVFTYLAYVHILNKRIGKHRNFMIRSYAFTLSAITLRAWMYLFSWMNIDYELSYIIVAWLAWMPNWSVAELIIYKQKYNES